jgi:hypothetical protein
MSADQDTMVRRLRRARRPDTAGLWRRKIRMAPQLDDLRDQTRTAMGMVGMAAVAAATRGGDIDARRDRIEALRRRAAAPEGRA